MIGLLQVDGKWPNLALMHLGAWFRQLGADARRISPMEQGLCERVYAAKVFAYSDGWHVSPNAVRGGTGWPDWRDLQDLPEEAEHCYPAYDLWACDYAMGMLTRGCVRHCPFCVIPQKEGRIRHHSHLSEWWRGQERIRLLDANLTAHPDCLGYLEELAASGAQVDFNQGLDARLVTEEIARAVAKVRRWGRYHAAWDRMVDEEVVLRGLRLLRDIVSQHNLEVYVLIGYDTTPEEDLYRVERLREERIDPFVMPYDRRDRYQAAFARWVNHKAIWRSCSWADYDRRVAA